MKHSAWKRRCPGAPPWTVRFAERATLIMAENMKRSPAWHDSKRKNKNQHTFETLEELSDDSCHGGLLAPKKKKSWSSRYETLHQD